MMREGGDLRGMIGEDSIEHGKWKFLEADSPNAAGMGGFPSLWPCDDPFHDAFKLCD